MSSLYNPNDFENLEVEITKIAYRQKVNVPLTQYALYAELLSVYDLKDPHLKNDLKRNTIIVMRHLDTLYEHFKLIDENDILSVILVDKDEPYININNKYNTHNVNDNTHNVNDNTLAKNDSMPLKKEVIDWIVDNNIDYSITKEDFKGNTILHYLVQQNDVDRIIKVLIKYDNLSFYSENYEGIRPLDLITSIKISNIVINQLNEKQQYLIKDIAELNKKYEIIDKKYEKTINEFKSIYFLLMIISLLIIVIRFVLVEIIF
jgi:hypothetical protein